MPSKKCSNKCSHESCVRRNRAAERKFGVSEKLVRDWRKAEVTLTEMKKTKKANRGLKARWPQLEERVRAWVLEQRAAGRGLSTVQLRLHAQKCDLYSSATYICFFLLNYAFFGWCDLYSGATYSPKNTVIDNFLI